MTLKTVRTFNITTTISKSILSLKGITENILKEQFLSYKESIENYNLCGNF